MSYQSSSGHLFKLKMKLYYTYNHDQNPNDRRFACISSFTDEQHLLRAISAYGDYKPQIVPMSCIGRLPVLPECNGALGNIQVNALKSYSEFINSVIVKREIPWHLLKRQ
jgi:hypothetical protein